MGYGDAEQGKSGWTVPDHVPADLVHEFDHWNGEEFCRNPMAAWDGLREPFRVFWSPLHGGFWCLTRYEDIHEAFRRADLFSSRITNIPGREVRLLPISMDPPDHTKYRRPLNVPLSPTSVGELEGQIRATANLLIDDVLAKGECDLVEAFANPLPVTIFLKLLGLSEDQLEMFLDWNYTILHVHGDPEAAERQRVANVELAAYLDKLIVKRRSEPGEDLVSWMISSRIDGEPIPHDEIRAFCHLLFMAGLDTVTSAISWLWLYLAEHPERRHEIVEDPSLIPSAIEELLRLHSFVTDSRTLTADAEFAGVHMKEGDRIMLPTASAGRDETQFPNAMEVDFHRDPNRHIAFANGPHRCVGSHLARLELIVAMQEWHRRIPDYRVTEGTTITFHGGALSAPNFVLLSVGA